MRLLNATTLLLSSFTEDRIPPFAILLHTCGDDEVAYEDIKSGLQATRKDAALSKIRYATLQAKADSFEWIWIDTCCIDKSSSAELQEAINSMYRWYINAQVCYVYLVDFDFREWPLLLSWDAQETATTLNGRHATALLAQCRWFSRGWTLQELMAPEVVKFYSRDWGLIGTKGDLSPLLVSVTKIEAAVLGNEKPLVSISVATRMSWAANRQTTRVEDQAYCLLGIFAVNIPMFYGEGSRAFIRLQEEIFRVSDDQSILAWGLMQGGNGTLLAESPADFADCMEIVPYGRLEQYEMTNRGLRMTLPLLPDDQHKMAPNNTKGILGLLNCRFDNKFDGALALHLREINDPDLYAVMSDVDAMAAIREVHMARSAPTALAAATVTSETWKNAGIRGSNALFYAVPYEWSFTRLAFVEMSRFRLATKAQIYIARSYSSQRSLPPFRLHFRSGSIEVIKPHEYHPARFWHEETNILRLPTTPDNNRRPAQGAVMLTHIKWQQTFVLHLWHDKFVVQGTSEGQYTTEIAPAIHLVPVEETRLLNLASLSMQHRPYTHRNGFCSPDKIAGLCSFSFGRCTYTQGEERMTLAVRPTIVMEERLFDVSIETELAGKATRSLTLVPDELTSGSLGASTSSFDAGA